MSERGALWREEFPLVVGSFAGVPATNKKANWRAYNAAGMRNGKAIKSRVYADNISLLRQLGVLPGAQATSA